ncbi:hypothetical protein PQX77_020689 [Marasmius sp. AFHP31]|nr:hypothetical protein PQX77_020689 [Marasmius sp. AFHP31]
MGRDTTLTVNHLHRATIATELLPWLISAAFVSHPLQSRSLYPADTSIVLIVWENMSTLLLKMDTRLPVPHVERSFPSRTCLPKQVQKFLFPTIRRVYLPDNSSEIERLQNALNASQTCRRRLEDQVGHLMEQCERHMSASAAHAKGEKDATMEIERLRRRLEREIEARQEAEEARDREIEKAAISLARAPVAANPGRNKGVRTALPPLSHSPYSGATCVQRVRLEDSSDDEAEIDTVSVGRNAHPLSVPEQSRDQNWSRSARQPPQSTEHVLNSRHQSQSSNQTPSASNASPIHRPAKRYIPRFESSDSDSDPDSDFGFEHFGRGLGGDNSDREEHENDGVVPRTMRSMAPATTPSSAITPRRRVMRQLPARPAKRMRA